jgi:AcrR family transcriptional regulator
VSAHADSEMAAADRGPGRPREPEVDQRILDAALRLMAQGGYVRMSMDNVAAEAGVTKPTIYRRYPGKVQLALAAIVAYCDQQPPIYTGNTRDDLIVEMSNFRRGLERPNGMAMLGTVLAEEHETPELLASFREYLVFPRCHAVRTILERARERGELCADADLALAGNMLIGAYYAQYLAGEPFADDWAVHVVDAVLSGISRTG